MSERITPIDETTPRMIAAEEVCSFAYDFCIRALGPSTESISIGLEVSSFVPGKKSMVELEIGYDSGATLNPRTSPRLDRAAIVLGSGLDYITIVFDNIRDKIHNADDQMRLINLDSVTIDSGDISHYFADFERNEEDVNGSIESGMQVGKFALHNVLLDRGDKRRIKQFMENPTLGHEVTVPTVLDRIFWSVEKLPEGICSWLVIDPPETSGLAMQQV